MAPNGDSSDDEFSRARPRASSIGSSSSREASPNRVKKRFHTPNSDDGIVVPPLPDDDTPPPEAPLIRQSLGFGVSVPPTVSTYKAPEPPSAPASFLPGQEVPQPKKKRARKNKEIIPEDGMARWRLKTYEPAPQKVKTPKAQRGRGPYASAYRAQVWPNAQAITGNHFSGSSTAGTASPSSETPYYRNAPAAPNQQLANVGRDVSPNSSAHYRRDYETARQPSSFTYPAVPHVQPYNSAPALAQASPQAPPAASSSPNAHPPITSPSSNAVPSHLTSVFSIVPQSSATSRSQKQSSQAQVQPHHLHAGLSHDPTTHSHTHASPPPSPYSSYDAHEGQSHVQNQDPQTSTSFQGRREHISRSRRPRRTDQHCVTVLMCDQRTEPTDYVLAEVHIPLTPNLQGSFWANAKDVFDELQNSPSRIHGPARVYTLRGRYRQFILAVTADNADDIQSTNICVSREKTLNTVIEMPPQPGAPPLPPQIPDEMLESDEDENTTHARELREAMVEIRRYRQEDELRYQQGRQPLYESSPTVDTDARPPTHGSPTQPLSPSVASGSAWRPSSSRAHNAGQSSISTADATVRSPRLHSAIRSPPSQNRIPSPEMFQTPLDIHDREWEYDSPNESVSPEKLFKLISKRVDPLIQTHDNWVDIFRSKGVPQSVPAVLKQYKLVQDLFDKYVGQRVPFRSTSRYKIEKTHITDALKFEDPQRYASDCTETLELVQMYGTEGSRTQDRRVVEMMEDKSAPTYNAKPIKRFLRLLREVDLEWKKEHPSGASPGESK